MTESGESVLESEREREQRESESRKSERDKFSDTVVDPIHPAEYGSNYHKY